MINSVFDFETKSWADLGAVGTEAYSQHPTTDVICACWDYGHHDDTDEWWPDRNRTDQIPNRLYKLIKDGGTITAWHVPFEICIWQNVMVKVYDWPEMPLRQWRDTMATACYYAMPAGLDKCANVLGLPGKNPEGARLISKYSKLYLKTAKQEIPDEDFFKFVDYCHQDRHEQREIDDIMGPLPPDELENFLDDLEINARGLRIDVEGINAASRLMKKMGVEFNERFREVTGGLNHTQRDKVLKWSAENGWPLENWRADDLKALVKSDDFPQGPVRTAVTIRLAINKASTKKLEAMARHAGDDGRARFQTRYHGAVTGRPTGSGFQPLNMSRGFDKVDPEQLVRDIMWEDVRWLKLLYGDPVDAIGKATRNFVKAEPGCRILSGDFVSVEAVVNACLAGEQWKIDAFWNKEPVYELMACRIHNLGDEAIELARNDKAAFKKKFGDERQDGKVGELSFGYQGALGAWLGFDSSGRHTDEAIIGFCKSWRQEHPMIVKSWKGYQNCGIAAVQNPGKEYQYRDMVFQIDMDNSALFMMGPTGKKIWYQGPHVRWVRPRWCKPRHPDYEECRNGTCGHDFVPQLNYYCYKNKNWVRRNTYGGKQCENAVQKESREILIECRKHLKKYGYKIILEVYDEVVSEMPFGQGSLEEFLEIMQDAIYSLRHSKDWPISVDGWEGSRYRK